MNAISVTMVKGTSSQTLHGYALRLTAAMVTLSWLGWQMLLISGSYYRRGVTGRATDFLEGGAVLLLYSLYLLLRVKRRDAAPTQESAKLFFGSFLLALLPMTYGIWRYLKYLLVSLHSANQMYGSNVPLVYTCVVVSVIYAVVILIWLNTNVPSYDHAKVGSLSSRTMRLLESWVLAPYSNK
ncbi:MAG TPA: hypothetical protein VHH73_16385 [Verrucomicrobiae bacterium]|nr:hypothetical protein [Verrucomicrobiae bacterium]